MNAHSTAAPREGLFAQSLRLPPQNLEAEQAVLGAVLSNNAAFERVDGLLPLHFADPVHAKIFGWIKGDIEAGRLADVMSLRGRADASALLEEVRGGVYLVQLAAATVGIIVAGEYAHIVREAWRQRQALDVAEALQTGAHSTEPAMGVLDAAVGTLQAVMADEAGKAAPVSAFAASDDAFAHMLAARDRPDGLAGLSYGYRALDRVTGGIMEAELVLLGARPSVGKSGLGLGIAARAAATLNDGRRVVFVTKEMRARGLQARLLAAASGVPLMGVLRGVLPDGPDRTRKITQGEVDAVYRAGAAMQGLPLEYVHDGESRWSRHQSRLRGMHRRGGLALVVVDYIGLMRASDAAERQGPTAAISELSAAMKDFALDLGVPVLALSQLSRANETRDDKRPQLSDLRQSGSLEQDADVVMFLHREEYYLKAFPPKRKDNETADAFGNRCSAHAERLREETGRAEVRVAKQRQGETLTTRLRFDGSRAFFWDEQDDQQTDALRPKLRMRDYGDEG